MLPLQYSRKWWALSVRVNMKSVFVAGWVLKAPLCVPWAVLTLRPCVVVVCVLNTCSPYPCHSGHRITLHRRLPGLAQLAAQEHQEHELRQPRLPQDHGGRRRRNPHRATQRVHRPRVPSSEWQPQSAILSASSRGRHHRQQFPLVLGGADALQQQMKGSLKYCSYAGMRNTIVARGLERKNSLAHAHFHTGFLNHHWGSRTFTNALHSPLCHLHDRSHTVRPFYHHHHLIASLPSNRTY